MLALNGELLKNDEKLLEEIKEKLNTVLEINGLKAKINADFLSKDKPNPNVFPYGVKIHLYDCDEFYQKTLSKEQHEMLLECKSICDLGVHEAFIDECFQVRFLFITSTPDKNLSKKLSFLHKHGNLEQKEQVSFYTLFPDETDDDKIFEFTNAVKKIIMKKEKEFNDIFKSLNKDIIQQLKAIIEEYK